MIIKMFKILLLTIIFITLSNFCMASNYKTGTTRGVFLKLNQDVRSAAMGDAYIAVSDDTGSIYWNPAGLIQLKRPELSSVYSSWLVDMNYASVAYAHPFDDFSLGLSFNYLNLGAIEETTLANPSGTGNVFTPSDYYLTASYSKKLFEGISWGANIKLINESIYLRNDAGVAVDLGVLWKINNDLSSGVSARNCIGSVSGGEIPTNFGVGLAYKYSNLLFAVDFNAPNDNQSTINLGTEYDYNDTFFVRLGYNTKNERNAGGNYGGGIGLKFSMMQLDYAYVPYGDLGVAHRLSLGFEFGAIPKKVIEVEVEKKVVTPEVVVPALREKISPEPFKPW
ncbi:MAG: PorV/PorQ family protein, partial [Nanoarchaeota archaeon]|nr:PorV/PorQ family protein [Nanoarchaeota archaeon]